MTLLVPNMEGWKNAILVINDLREKGKVDVLKKILGRHMLKKARFSISFQRFERLVDYGGNEITISSDLNPYCKRYTSRNKEDRGVPILNDNLPVLRTISVAPRWQRQGEPSAAASGV